jgi:NifU-like protein involved in Fe-S cluster formation
MGRSASFLHLSPLGLPARVLNDPPGRPFFLPLVPEVHVGHLGAMSELYHNRILELAAGIPNVGQLEDAEGEALKVSRVCGSTVHVALKLDEAGEVVTAIAVDPKACALGQASTSILSANAVGATTGEIRAALDALRAMLKEGGAPPEGRFWELRHLEPVADYPPRHASTLLAFEAAVAAIDQALATRVAV